jgi:hypothetical protein
MQLAAPRMNDVYSVAKVPALAGVVHGHGIDTSHYQVHTALHVVWAAVQVPLGNDTWHFHSGFHVCVVRWAVLGACPGCSFTWVPAAARCAPIGCQWWCLSCASGARQWLAGARQEHARAVYIRTAGGTDNGG